VLQVTFGRHLTLAKGGGGSSLLFSNFRPGACRAISGNVYFVHSYVSTPYTYVRAPGEGKKHTEGFSNPCVVNPQHCPAQEVFAKILSLFVAHILPEDFHRYSNWFYPCSLLTDWFTLLRNEGFTLSHVHV
jgi:hypothetical protein